MRLQIVKLQMSKNIRTRDGARHFVTEASDVSAHGVGRVVGALGCEAGFAGSMLN